MYPVRNYSRSPSPSTPLKRALGRALRHVFSAIIPASSASPSTTPVVEDPLGTIGDLTITADSLPAYISPTWLPYRRHNLVYDGEGA